MYQISRGLYRKLADHMVGTGPGVAGSDQQRVLEACERAVHRLATDRFYFARPARSLFREIRWYFPRSAQRRVYAIIEHHLALTATTFARDPKTLLALTGHRLECRASTRKGRECRRPPQANGYCPSHQHLADSELPLAA
jgi:hypothetical protein